MFETLLGGHSMAIPADQVTSNKNLRSHRAGLLQVRWNAGKDYLNLGQLLGRRMTIVDSSPRPKHRASPTSASRGSGTSAKATLRDDLLSSPRATKRVCMVAYTFYESDNRVRRYAETLVKHGYRVDVVALWREGQAKGESVLNGVRIFRIQRRVKSEKSSLMYLGKLVFFFFRSMFLLVRSRSRSGIVSFTFTPSRISKSLPLGIRNSRGPKSSWIFMTSFLSSTPVSSTNLPTQSSLSCWWP